MDEDTIRMVMNSINTATAPLWDRIRELEEKVDSLDDITDTLWDDKYKED